MIFLLFMAAFVVMTLTAGIFLHLMQRTEKHPEIGSDEWKSERF